MDFDGGKRGLFGNMLRRQAPYKLSFAYGDMDEGVSDEFQRAGDAFPLTKICFDIVRALVTLVAIWIAVLLPVHIVSIALTLISDRLFPEIAVWDRLVLLHNLSQNDRRFVYRLLLMPGFLTVLMLLALSGRRRRSRWVVNLASSHAGRRHCQAASAPPSVKIMRLRKNPENRKSAICKREKRNAPGRNRTFISRLEGCGSIH